MDETVTVKTYNVPTSLSTEIIADATGLSAKAVTQMYMDSARAQKLRDALRAGRAVSDEDQRWLADRDHATALGELEDQRADAEARAAAPTVAQLIARLRQLDPSLPVEVSEAWHEDVEAVWPGDLDDVVEVRDDRVHIGL